MKISNYIIHLKNLYILFIYLSLIIFFFSTEKVYSKSFDIENIEISKPFEMKFNKNEVIDEGFKKAFVRLISLIVKSPDLKKIKQVKLNEIKGMIETFSIKEEKFINEVYFVNLGVTFNKKKIFQYLEQKNIFPSIPKKKKFLFIPIIIDESNKDLLIFTNNEVFSEWNEYVEKHHLIEYILPTEDLEDLRIIKRNYESIEQYDFREITNKYFLNESIISLIFKKEDELRILSRITIKDEVYLKNQSFFDIDLKNNQDIEKLVKQLKTNYEDFWKNSNLINTSIKLPLTIRVDSLDNKNISNFEDVLDDMDLIYNYFISKFDKDFIYYEIVFNGTPSIFLKSMREKRYEFNTENKIWILK